MGFDLSGKNDSIHFNSWGWEKILCLAAKYGWQPEGSHAPHNGRIEGDDYLRADRHWRQWNANHTIADSYMTNDYQIVSAADAIGIANALQKALVDIPDEDVIRLTPNPELEAALKKSEIPRPLPPDTPLTHCFSGTGKRTVEEFIEFCKGGEFVIG